MADDKNEIQVAAEHFLRALGNLDWERFVACWSSDPNAFYPLRASGPPYLSLEPRNLCINRYGEAGLVTFMIPDRPGPTPLRFLLFVREAGAWKLAHLHATNRVLMWWVAKLRAEGVRVLEEPYRLGDTRAVMIEGPSREALELVEVR